MSELPKGWKICSLAELVGPEGLLSDGDWIESKDQDPAGTIRLTQLADIGDGKFLNKSARYVNAQTASRLRCTFLKEGDLLIARMPDPLGRACIFPDVRQPAITAVDVFIWRTDGSRADARWAVYAVNSPDLRDEMQSKAGGTTRQRIAGGKLKEITLPTPPLPEQRLIALKLDSLTGRTARAREQLGRIPTLIQKYREAILSAAFSGELTQEWRAAHRELKPVSPRPTSEIRAKYRCSSQKFVPPFDVPRSWQWLRLPEIGDLDRGKSKHRPRNDPSLFGGSYPFIQTGEVREAGQYLTKFSKTYSDKGLAQSRLWPSGTVCITIAANIAETAILSIDACFPDSVVGFTSDPKRTSPEFIEFFLRTARAELAAFAPATAQKNINLDTLANIRVPVAPLIEQREIARRIETAFAWLDRVVAEHANASRLVPKLDQAILAKAFRGELLAEDPNNESMST